MKTRRLLNETGDVYWPKQQTFTERNNRRLQNETADVYRTKHSWD